MCYITQAVNERLVLLRICKSSRLRRAVTCAQCATPPLALTPSHFVLLLRIHISCSRFKWGPWSRTTLPMPNRTKQVCTCRAEDLSLPLFRSPLASSPSCNLVHCIAFRLGLLFFVWRCILAGWVCGFGASVRMSSRHPSTERKHVDSCNGS